MTFQTESTGDFVLGLIAGTFIGVGLLMLLAPKARSEFRERVSERAGSAAQSAGEQYRRLGDKARQWADHSRDVGKKLYDDARETMNEMSERGSKAIDDANPSHV